jgi:eukaryotic-like serine/threonine-protein kinase
MIATHTILQSRYRIDELIDRGGMADVYRGRDVRLERDVAVKVLREVEHERRFAAEARTLARLQHPNLVRLLDAGTDNGDAFLVLELLGGATVRQLLDGGALPSDRVARIGTETTAALDYIHRQGIVHRDVKPSNVIIDETGSANLTDFGLAKGRAYTVLTKPGTVMGTLDYLAPEMLRGSEATGASDIYGLGCVTFECTAGRAPFADKSMFDLASAHLNLEPPDPCADRADAPEGLSWAILQALAKEPDKRPPTATAYAHLISFAGGSGEPSPSLPAPPPPPPQ